MAPPHEWLPPRPVAVPRVLATVSLDLVQAYYVMAVSTIRRAGHSTATLVLIA